MNISTSRGRSFDFTVPQICHQFHTTVELLDDLMSKSNKGMATMIEDSNTIVDKEPDQRRYCHASSNASSDSTSKMINALEILQLKFQYNQLPK